MSKPKIKIFQYMHGNFEYFRWSEQINRRYCERHGYDYVVRHDEPRTDRHICWHKIPFAITELQDCDYLLCVDADAVFYSHELTIENELLPKLHDKRILMPADCGSESERWQPEYLCDAVMLMKNDARVRDMLTQWDHTSEIDEETRWVWPPTQLALRRHILPKFRDEIQSVADYYGVHGRWGQFIRHFYLASDESRTRAMKTIVERVAAGR